LSAADVSLVPSPVIGALGQRQVFFEAKLH